MKPKVLIIDDDEEFTQLVEYNLGQQGCEIIRARNGLEGLTRARSEMPDVILLDILLPDLDGLVVCQILHAQPRTRGIPVFMLSALTEGFAGTRKRYAPFEIYFTKPVDFSLLGGTIRRATQARHESLSSAAQKFH